MSSHHAPTHNNCPPESWNTLLLPWQMFVNFGYMHHFVFKLRSHIGKWTTELKPIKTTAEQ